MWLILESSALLVFLLVTLDQLSKPATAYPQLYVVKVAEGNCLSHPARGYKRHRAPSTSSSISMRFSPASPASAAAAAAAAAPPFTSFQAAAVTSLCAGRKYSVTIMDDSMSPAAANALATTSMGTLTLMQARQAASNSSTTNTAYTDGDVPPGSEVLQYLRARQTTQLREFAAQCPNRVTTSTAVDKLQLLLGVPDDAAGNLTLQVTMATSRSDAFKQAAATIPVKLTCDATLSSQDTMSSKGVPSPFNTTESTSSTALHVAVVARWSVLLSCLVLGLFLHV